MLYLKGSHRIEKHHVFTPSGTSREVSIPFTAATIAVPDEGAALCRMEGDEVKVILTGRGSFKVSSDFNRLSVRACGGDDMEIVVCGRGDVVIRGAVRLTVKGCIIVKAYEQTKVDATDTCRVLLYHHSSARLHFLAECEAYDDSIVYPGRYSRPRLFDRARLEGKPTLVEQAGRRS